jgi:cell division protein FtsW
VEKFTQKEEMERSARIFFTLVMLLIVVGLVMVYSASAVKSGLADDGRTTAPLVKQLVKISVALAGMLLMMKIDYRLLARHHMKILAGIVIFLIFVMLPVPGVCGPVNGSRRWLQIGSFMVQPSEFAKLGLVIVLASMIIRSRERIRDFRGGFMPCIAATGLVCVLILVEPDFGTCALTGAVAVLLLVIGGARISHFLLLVSVCAPLLFFFAYSNLTHVRERIAAWLQPQATGQVAEGLTGLGSGVLAGRGLGAGVAKLYYVPLCESDFIYSIIGEELGLAGATGVLLAFVFLVYHGMKVLLGVKNRFGFILSLGVLLLISTQALANIAVVLGMTPAKGIALPFISSGGSSLMALMLGVGIFMRVAKYPDLPAPRFKEEELPSFVRNSLSRVGQVMRRGGGDD